MLNNFWDIVKMELSNGCVCDAVISQNRTLATLNSMKEFIHK
jgi:hypothetical protein